MLGAGVPGGEMYSSDGVTVSEDGSTRMITPLPYSYQTSSSTSMPRGVRC